LVVSPHAARIPTLCGQFVGPLFQRVNVSEEVTVQQMSRYCSGFRRGLGDSGLAIH